MEFQKFFMKFFKNSLKYKELALEFNKRKLKVNIMK